MVDPWLFPVVDRIADDASVGGVFTAQTSLTTRDGRSSVPVASLYQNTLVLPEIGVAMTGGRIIEATTVRPYLLKHYRENQRIRKYPIVPLRGTVACLNVGTSSHRNYYHQWIDALPRAWVLGKLQLPGEMSVRILVTGNPTSEFKRVVDHLSGGRHLLRTVPRFIRVRPTNGCLHLPVPSLEHAAILADGSMGLLPSEFLNDFGRAVDELFVLTRATGPRKIYVSRRSAVARRVVNEAQVATFMQQHGFAVVELETLDVRDQMLLFRNADTIVSQHGAALTNLLYCRPETTVVEIFGARTGGGIALYERLSRQLQLDYRALDLGGSSKDADIVLSIDHMLDIVSPS